MKKFVFVLLVLLLLSPGVNAGTEYHASVEFAPGAIQNSSYDYLWISKENNTRPAWINISANTVDMEIRISEANVENITLDAQKAMNHFGISTNDIKPYLSAIGKLKIIISGNGTNNYTIKNLPAIAHLYLDGKSWSYDYQSSTLHFSTHMSTHTVVVQFKQADIFAGAFQAIEVISALVVAIPIIFILNTLDDVVFGNILKKMENYMKKWR